MEDQQRVIELVDRQNSPENNIRREAELSFIDLYTREPEKVMYVLTEKALEESAGVTMRQSCLLHLKRLVPKFWSLAFQSFIGPPISQQLKKMIRSGLIHIIATADNTKLLSGASYTIIQIAASDFPDEWPELLLQLYELTGGPSDVGRVGGLTVLNELFDDLITEEQFWEQGIGNEIIYRITGLLGDAGTSTRAKTACIKLYQSIFNILQSPEAYVNDQRKEAMYQHVESFSALLTSLLISSSTTSREQKGITLSEFNLRLNLYKVINGLIGGFRRKIPLQTKRGLLNILMNDFAFVANCYHNSIVLNDLTDFIIPLQEFQDPEKVVIGLVVEMLQVIATLQHSIPLSEDMGMVAVFVQGLVLCSELPEETIEEYEVNFNAYVTDITGLSISSSVREAVNELLSELNENDSLHVFNIALGLLDFPDTLRWQLKECYIFILESLFMNSDTSRLGDDMSLTALLESLEKFISFDFSANNHCILCARVFLMLPKFFEKFETKLSAESFGIKSFIDMVISVASYGGTDENFNIVKVGMLVSCTFDRNIFDLKKSIPPEEKARIQLAIFETVVSLIEDSEEDTLSVLLEGVTVAIHIDHKSASKLVLPNGINAIDSILKISFKDAANLQLIVDSSEALKELFHDISLPDYLSSCEKSLTFVISIIKNSFVDNEIKYSPELALALDLLSIIIDSAPESGPDVDSFPKEAFLYAFPVLNNLIILCTDDQILQTAGEVFNKLLEKAANAFAEYSDPVTKQSGLDLLMMSVSKFLSPSLSDTAAMNCGLIVLSLINKFQNVLGVEYLLQTLEATVKRLVIAKEVIITENLVMVFCNLVLKSPKDTVDFLADKLRIPDPKTGEIKSGLTLVLPIWFQSFEITRGYEKIKRNSLALAQIFSLNDSRVREVIVNGDLIPYAGDRIRTRSFTKDHPDEYTQIVAPLKILKLLISELKFQIQQPETDSKNYKTLIPEGEDNTADEKGEDDWEDMEDIGIPDYDKLKSYVNSDSEGELEDQNGNEDLKNILFQFFRECTTKNLGNFSEYYEYLNDEEKKVITEALLF